MTKLHHCPQLFETYTTGFSQIGSRPKGLSVVFIVAPESDAMSTQRQVRGRQLAVTSWTLGCIAPTQQEEVHPAPAHRWVP
ncbi:hypothetical protein VTK56DRAFT_2924 [Thermocarpiscus australiensis]